MAKQIVVNTHHTPHGKIVVVHQGHDFTAVLHPEHLKAIRELPVGGQHHFQDEQGMKWRATKGETHVHLKHANQSYETSFPIHHLNEEVVTETLSKSAPVSTWIHDFVHSKNSKFEGKSRKDRIRMALGAYYGKQNEERAYEENRINEAWFSRKKGLGGTDETPDTKAHYDYPSWKKTSEKLGAVSFHRNGSSESAIHKNGEAVGHWDHVENSGHTYHG